MIVTVGCYLKSRSTIREFYFDVLKVSEKDLVVSTAHNRRYI